MKFYLSILFIFYCLSSTAQLKSGPMLGHITNLDAKIWLQSNSEDSIKLIYYSENNVENILTQIQKPQKESWNTLEFHLQNLLPNNSYHYTVEQSGLTIFDGKFKTQRNYNKDSLIDFKFAVGSCAYLSDKVVNQTVNSFGKTFSIFNAIKNAQPDFMLWLGDNIYLRNNDWNSKTGIYNRYTQFKSNDILQEFWSQTSHYAIWDDHDFGPNDADRSFINKEISLQAFTNFWSNPSYGIDQQLGITTQFSYEDVDFFLLDNRYFRSPNNRKTGEKEILGNTQVEWLIDALVSSKANFKFVAIGGQFLSDAKVWENHANYEKERRKILELIEKEGLKNIIFLSGDRHKTELTQLQLKNKIILYDYTSSPLAAKAFNSEFEGNTLQVDGSHFATQNFGVLTIYGDNKNRELKITTFDSTGRMLYTHIIKMQ